MPASIAQRMSASNGDEAMSVKSADDWTGALSVALPAGAPSAVGGATPATRTRLSETREERRTRLDRATPGVIVGIAHSVADPT